MQFIPQILFILLSAVAIWLFSKKAKEIIRNIRLGKNDLVNDNPSQRWRNLFLLAFGQQKMFRNPLVAVMHFFVYAGFIIINIEVLEIVLDGILGNHRLFAEPLGGLYSFLINAFEVLALLVLVGCVIFLVRRNIIKLKRFISKDLNGWPRSDANYILITEIVLMSLFLTMNSADRALQLQGHEHYKQTGDFVISGIFAENLSGLSASSLIFLERFGAKDVFDLGQKHLLDAYSCTECGRCSAACPATQTGKLLSPRKIMMDTRDRMEEVGKNINVNGEFKDDGKNLLNYITVEELRACTTCNACVQECPVSISPLDIIIELRRSLVMEDSNAPQEWNAMFSNVENNFAPWKFSPDERDKWAEEMKTN